MLVLNQRAVEIQDTVVTSFLFLEKSRRTNERTEMNAADVRGAPALNPLGKDYRATNQGIGIWSMCGSKESVK